MTVITVAEGFCLDRMFVVGGKMLAKYKPMDNSINHYNDDGDHGDGDDDDDDDDNDYDYDTGTW